MLSKRLQAVYDLIPVANSLADVGTDHGYLPIALVKNNKIGHVYAIDNKKSPLKKAKSNIEKNNLETSITPLLSDGIFSLNEFVEIIVIAGMGVKNAINILENNPEIYLKAKLIIIEAKNSLSDLRAWLNTKQYPIVLETITFEKHYYQALAFIPQKDTNISYSLNDIKFGPLLKKEKIGRASCRERV